MINFMNNVPPDTSGKTSVPQTVPTLPVATTGIGKETESAGFPDGEPGLRDTTKEMELPKEVEAIGVKTQPTVIPMPQAVREMGVRPAGPNIPVYVPPAITLPLSEYQIAQGLHVSVIDSFRWLAEWCRRKLKQIGIIK